MSRYDDNPVERPTGNTAGRRSLWLGIVALAALLAPVLGDLLAAPIGLVAVGLGAVGIRRTERGVATNFAQSLAGVALGSMAVLIVLFVFAVTR